MPRITDAERFINLNHYEDAARRQGYRLIAGVDEAGRGPLAGPVAAAAVILDPDKPILGLNDSKKLSEAKREMLFQHIKRDALATAVILIDAQTIDQINILAATKLAMRQAVAALQIKPDYVLIDAVQPGILDIPVQALIKGDALSNSIAAASILAKVTRDHLMLDYDRQYPGYGFAQHKGYGTAAHYAALRALGESPIHRQSFLKSFKPEVQ